MNPTHEEIIARALAAFRADLDAVPAVTLRGGDAIDGYDHPPPYDPDVDQPTDEYLERYCRGLGYLDAASWRHYLPRLIAHALRTPDGAWDVTDALLWTLRPPDREPPRLTSLTAEQEAVVVAALEALAFGDASVWKEDAMQVLEEYWIPGALYRASPPASG